MVPSPTLLDVYPHDSTSYVEGLVYDSRAVRNPSTSFFVNYEEAAGVHQTKPTRHGGGRNTPISALSSR